MKDTFAKPQHFWNHFLSIEEYLVRTTGYLELHEENKSAFSTQFTKIVLTTSAEVDILLKETTELFGLEKKRPNFGDYDKYVNENFPSLIKEDVVVTKYGMDISPFRNWNEKEELSWHKSYNDLKHNRRIHFKKGNLENALCSVGALFSTVIHYYKAMAEHETEQKFSINAVINSLDGKAELIGFGNSKHHIRVIQDCVAG